MPVRLQLFRWLCAAGLACTLTGAAQDFVKDGQLDLPAVVKYVEDMYRADSSQAEIELTVARPRQTRALVMSSVTRGSDRALIVIREPARELGTATLKVERNLWNFLPRIRRTIRIPPSMMLASWMGSDFTNDDLVQSSSYSKDYTYELLGQSATPPGWTIRFTAKPDLVGLWSRFDLIVSPDGKLPLEALYYDRRERPARKMVWDQVRDFDGKPLPARLTLTPLDQEGHRTVLVYRSLKFAVALPDGTFSLEELERSR